VAITINWEKVWSLPNPGYQYNIFEAAYQTTGGSMTGALVSGGNGQGAGIGCGPAGQEKRAAMFDPTLQIPLNFNQNITLTSGWFMGAGSQGAVKLPAPFILTAPGTAAGGGSPSPQPTIAPTPRPTSTPYPTRMYNNVH
jgi:hypothetical protein